MIDDVLRQKLVNIAQPSIALVTGILPARLDGQLVKGQGVGNSGGAAVSESERHSMLAATSSVFDSLLNSFKHFLHNTIAPHGMKSECFFLLHSTRA